VAPLKAAEDAVVIDTDQLNIDEVVAAVLAQVER
jgi:cytidylate kinase